jgi:hypothetical protein
MLFENDCPFGVKVAYLFHRVFQKSINKLSTYHHWTRPITATHRRCKRKQMDYTGLTLQGIKFGTTPLIHLPESLTLNQRDKDLDPKSDQQLPKDLLLLKKLANKGRSLKANTNQLAKWALP